jgi:hypothetical protein
MGSPAVKGAAAVDVKVQHKQASATGPRNHVNLQSMICMVFSLYSKLLGFNPYSFFGFAPVFFQLSPALLPWTAEHLLCRWQQ